MRNNPYLYISIDALRYYTSAIKYELADCISCTVKEQRNGMFDLELKYPLNGWNSNQILPNAIVMVEPRRGADEEPFKIYEVEQTIDGVLTARAHHLVYELDGIIGSGLKSTGIAAAVTEFNNTTVVASYNMWGDMYSFFELVSSGITDTSTVIVNSAPISMWAYLGQLVEIFNGELSYHYIAAQNKVQITLSSARGTAKDTIIKYGVNIVGLDRKLNSNNLYKEVTAYWWDGADYNNSFVYGTVSTGITGTFRTFYLDCSKVFQTQPTLGDLLNAANNYIASNYLTSGIQDDLTVNFVPLEITTESITSQQLDLCDTAEVDASNIGVTATAKCIEVVYNVITEKYDSVTVGIFQNTIIDTIASIKQSSPSSSEWKPSTGALIVDLPEGSSISSASGSYTNKASITLPAGTWCISFGCWFSSNATGIRGVVLSLTSGSSSSIDRSTRIVDTALSGTSTSLNGTTILQLTASTTIYLNCYQNSGSSLTAYPWIRAVKII